MSNLSFQTRKLLCHAADTNTSTSVPVGSHPPLFLPSLSPLSLLVVLVTLMLLEFLPRNSSKEKGFKMAMHDDVTTESERSLSGEWE